jgi:hypothetical protein
MTRERVLLQRVLNQHREPIHALPHVGQPKAKCTFTPAGTIIIVSSPAQRRADALRPDRSFHVRTLVDHLADQTLSCLSANGSTCKASAAGRGFVWSLDCSLDSTTGASSAFAFRPYPNSARQRNKALVASLCARAAAETLFPGCSRSSTMTSFSSLVKSCKNRTLTYEPQMAR